MESGDKNSRCTLSHKRIKRDNACTKFGRLVQSNSSINNSCCMEQQMRALSAASSGAGGVMKKRLKRYKKKLKSGVRWSSAEGQGSTLWNRPEGGA